MRPESTCVVCSSAFRPSKYANKTVLYCSRRCNDTARRARNPEVKRARDRAYGMRPENREKRAQRAKEWREENAHRLSEYRLSAYMKWKYRITQDDYDRMFVEQEGKCAVCGGDDYTPWNRLVVDHDHKTGYVRALLCHACNVSIGQAKDDPTILRRAAEYLERFS